MISRVIIQERLPKLQGIYGKTLSYMHGSRILQPQKTNCHYHMRKSAPYVKILLILIPKQKKNSVLPYLTMKNCLKGKLSGLISKRNQKHSKNMEREKEGLIDQRRKLFSLPGKKKSKICSNSWLISPLQVKLCGSVQCDGLKKLSMMS